MRRKSSRFWTHLSELRRHQMWEQSDHLPQFLPFFVGDEVMDQIHMDSNQIIVGRRGTGKTHLLGAFCEKVWGCPNELAIRISILELGQTPPLAYTESPEFAAKRIAREKFEQFLRVFCNQLLIQVTRYGKTKLPPYLTAHEAKKIRKEADDLLWRLMVAIEVGREYRPSKTRRGMEPDAEVVIGVDLYEVRDLLSQLIDTLQLSVLYILIDEWMELDKNTANSIQENFAQLLKITFFNHAKISIKIASVWHGTSLYSKGDMATSRGLQLGHDIQMGPDLDTAFLTDDDAIFRFGREVLFKRLSYAVKGLEPLGQHGAIDDMFIDEIFDNQDNFKAFLAASHGIPRDMVKIFFKCSAKINYNFKNDCIDYRLVSEVAKDTYRTVKRKSIDPSSTAQRMVNLIDDYLERTGRRLFLIENSQAHTCAHVRELVDDEVIHQIPSSMTPRSIRNTHKAFHIDYGNMVDWFETKNKDLSEIVAYSLAPKFSPDFADQISSYVLDAVAIAKDHVSCRNCGHDFMANHPIYRKHGSCPVCGADQPPGF